MNNYFDGKDKKGTFFQYSGNSKYTPTIFIHGVGLDNTMWYPQKNFFRNKNVIFYDILNHGKSKKGYRELSFRDFSNQLNNLINFLKFDKYNLVGFSIGALIAQHFTQKYYKNVNKLILIGSVYKRSEKQISIVKKRYLDALKGEDISDSSIKRWFTDNYLENNREVYNFFYDLLKSKNNKDFLVAYKVFVESDLYTLNFKNFTMPTLIMTGKNEVGSTPSMSIGIHKEITKSQIYIINDAKHGATIEKANTVNKKIYNFLY